MVAEDIYTQLVRKINYPDPKSERLLRIFRKLASPDEARLLLELPSEPADSARKLGISEDTVRQMIGVLTEKGLIITTGKGPRMVRDVTQFHDANLASSEKWVDTELLDLWKDFYEVEWFPTMGNIPADAYVQYIRVVPAWTAIERSPEIAPGQLRKEENLKDLVNSADTIAVVPCTCRRSMRRCSAPLHNCVVFNRGAEYAISRGAGRQISTDEAMAIFAESEKLGLVHTWPFFASPRLNEVCNCCSDCCGIFDAGLKFGTLDRILEKAHVRAGVDHALCNGCQDCIERCFFGAIEMQRVPQSKKLKAVVNTDKCFGCGVCVLGCEVGAMAMKMCDG
ncbi:MAG: 4Fe-4S dicluster domain-containing protein [Dehalococcoidia bacterium]|nr:4Fe-4S dicluster domain-containing protein [Dehalococcoidia bacterium]